MGNVFLAGHKKLAFVGLCFVAVVCAAANVQAADSSPQAVLKFAPRGTVAIIHADGKVLADYAGKLSAEMKKNGGMEEWAKVVLAYQKVLAKVDSLDVYVVFGKKGPVTAFVARTSKLTVEEVGEFARMNIPDFEKAIFSEPQDGRYVLGPFVVVDGKKAADVGDGIIMVVDRSLDVANDMIQLLKTGVNDNLTELAKKIDDSAPVWAVGDFTFMADDPEAPKSFFANLYPDGKKTSILSLEFKDTKSAEKTEKGVASEGLWKDVLEIKRSESVVAFSATMDNKFLLGAIKSLVDASARAKRVASAANLSAIGKAVSMWMAKRDDQQVPPDLNALIKDKLITADALVSPATGRKLKTDDKGMPTEASDYIYIILPTTAEGNLVRAYEPPEINKGEGGNVLFADGRVTWLKADDLKAAVKKTMDAIKKDKK